MRAILLLIILILSSVLAFGQRFCGFTVGELEKMGPWTCPEYMLYKDMLRGYRPSPGFPGNPNPIVLDEVTVVAPKGPTFPTIILPTNTFQPNIPFKFNESESDKPTKQQTPCQGDALVNSKITPSDKAKKNIKGGRFGNTRRHSNGRPKMHGGTDLAAEPNTPVYPIAEGTVTRIFDGAKYNQYDPVNGMGNFIEYRTTINGVTYLIMYGHLNFINNLSIGSPVSPDKPIGLSGQTGNLLKNPSNPNGYDAIPHVHVQVKDENGNLVDPENVLRTKYDGQGNPINPCKN